MKTKILFLAMLVLCIVSGCTENADPSPTEQISKVETSYVQGQQEKTPTGEETIETSAPDWYIEELYQREMKREISARMAQRSNGRTSAVTDYDIGLIVANNGNCPGEKILIYMDCDDFGGMWPPYNPQTKATPRTSNSESPWAIDTKGNITMTFCRVNGPEYYERRYGNQHAVLRLGALLSAPRFGGTTITRYFDNEDNSNENYTIGNIGVNNQGRNTTLYFWTLPPEPFFPNSGPGLGYKGMGVFGKVNNLDVADGWHYYIDDEDSQNANYWVVGPTKRVSSFSNDYFSGGKNTSMEIVIFK